MHPAGNHPYVIISCEGKSVRSIVKKDTYQPDFETGAVFYRKKVTKPLTVQVSKINKQRNK